MKVANRPQINQPNTLKRAPKKDEPEQPEHNNSNAISDFYHQYQTPVHIGGGALMGAGLARALGLPGEVAMSAAGTGAVAGFFAGSPKKAVCMAGGAAVGAAIATLAGVPNTAVLGAAGTGTLVGWLFS